MSRLPVTGSDDGTWGDVLNDFLAQEHKNSGLLKIRDEKGAANGLAPLNGSSKVPLANLPAGAGGVAFPDVGDLVWTNITLLNGWQVYSTANPGDFPQNWQSPRWARVGAMVFLQGLIDGTVASNNHIADLPSEIIPGKNRWFVAAGANGALQILNIYGASSGTPGRLSTPGASVVPAFTAIDTTYIID
jgi:hypothetical protein